MLTLDLHVLGEKAKDYFGAVDPRTLHISLWNNAEAWQSNRDFSSRECKAGGSMPEKSPGLNWPIALLRA